MTERMPMDAIESYRGFIANGDTLVGPVAHAEWHPGVNVSECAHCPEAPKRRCTCGFYSFTTQTLALAEWSDWLPRGRTITGKAVKVTTGVDDLGGVQGELVLAVVKNAGLIWRGSRGYRSQYAEVSALLTNNPDVFAAILDRYGIIAVIPDIDESALCEGLVHGFRGGGDGLAAIQIVSMERRELSGEYWLDATSDSYTKVAVAGVGARVELAFEVRTGRRWVTRLRLPGPPTT